MKKSDFTSLFSSGQGPTWNLYPLQSPSTFCDLIKHSRKGIARCIKSDREAFQVVIRSKQPFIYECHAGLIDAIIPLIVEDVPVAFLMLGQFLPEQSGEEKFQEMWEKVRDLELPYEEIRKAYFKLPQVPMDFVENIAQGIFDTLKEILTSIPPILIREKEKKVLDVDAKIWLIQQEWQILRISKEERELLSFFNWASEETILRYFSGWVKRQLETFDRDPAGTKSRIWGTITSNTGASKHRASLLERVKMYILQHYGMEKLSLKELARVFRLSPYYLSHLFKSSEGISIGKFIKDLRITRAKELLESGNTSVTDIALEVGYSDPAYFSKIFKKEIGLSPSQYRRKIKQNTTK